ncbi:MAG: Na+/H+ antiporter subunit D [Anaerolineae bacterium]|nr:Na+/H+ antiporter subunit D [Anaerolineae bacterium]
MDMLLVLPIVIPFSMGIICIATWGQRQLHRLIALAGTSSLLLIASLLLLTVQQDGPISTEVGNWPAPFGIVIVADLFSAIMVMMAALMGFCVVLFSFGSIDPQRERFGYYPSILFLLMGVCGAFLTGDLFNLYVWFEVMLISSFVLLGMGGERAQLEGAIKYFALNLLISAFFLSAVGILYAITGALNMADLSLKLQTVKQPELVPVVAVLFLVAFGIKAAAFPFFFWLPASYHVPPVAVTTLFSGLMTKVGVYAMIRVFTLLFTQQVGYTHGLILVIAGFTMVTGVLGAMAQYDFRRLLSFHIISQIGYLLMGLGLYTVTSLAGTIFFMVHVIIAKSALFLVSGIAQRVGGTYDLKKLGSFYRGYPLLAVLFVLPAFSLAGIPPLSGFWAKLVLIRAGLETDQYLIVLVALVVSVLTLYSMTKIWAEAFWKDSPTYHEADIEQAVEAIPRRDYRLMLLPLVLLASLTLLIGLIAEPVMNLALEAAAQLRNPDLYLQAVLGNGVRP